MEQNFQDLDQKIQYYKNPDIFASHFAQYFNQKIPPQQCREIIKFEIIYTVSPIGSIKNWHKSQYTLCVKERL